MAAISWNKKMGAPKYRQNIFSEYVHNQIASDGLKEEFLIYLDIFITSQLNLNNGPETYASQILW